MHKNADIRHVEFSRMDTASAQEILAWAYAAPYDIYNLSSDTPDDELAYRVHPNHAFYRLVDETGMLVAFCSFGQDGQVAGATIGRTPWILGWGCDQT